MRATLLLPTLNEVEGLPRTLDRIPRAALEAAGFDLEVAIVDGASTDGTPELARSRGLHVITEPRKGYGRAYKTGFAAAAGDLVVTADADDTYPLDGLVALLERVRADRLDFVTLNRLAEMDRGAMRPMHRFGNAILTFAARVLYGVTLRDSQSGMWVLSRRALERIPYASLSDGMAFSQELKLRAFRDRELRSAELPGRYYVRVGEVKLASWRDGTRNLWALVRRRFRAG